MTLVILDRDGVINFDSTEYIKSPEEWLPMPGSLDAIAQLNRAGYQVVIATNQSGVGRGYYDLETLDSIHEKLMRELAAHGGYVDHIFFCPHRPDDGCDCRKPKPGLLHQIAEKYQVDLRDTFFIGDSSGDVSAALAVGSTPVLVMTGNGQTTSEKFPDVKRFADLAAAVEYIISHAKQAHHV